MQKIFLIDDDSDDRLLFAEALHEVSHDYQLEMAANGKDALFMLSQMTQLPDITIMDINMPVMDGFQCLKLIREDDKLRGLPVIIMSTSSERWAINRAYLCGANYFTPKPICF